jgi:hypothetical protein
LGTIFERSGKGGVALRFPPQSKTRVESHLINTAFQRGACRSRRWKNRLNGFSRRPAPSTRLKPGVNESGARFPLTLTLSLGEREQPADTFVKFASRAVEHSRSFAKTRRAFLPLRVAESAEQWGEDRGEVFVIPFLRRARNFIFTHHASRITV